MVKLYQYLGQMALHSTVIISTQIHTHGALIARLGPLKWSLINCPTSLCATQRPEEQFVTGKIILSSDANETWRGSAEDALHALDKYFNGSAEWRLTYQSHEWRLTYQSHVWRPTYQSHVWRPTYQSHEWRPTYQSHEWRLTYQSHEWRLTYQSHVWRLTYQSHVWRLTYQSHVWRLTYQSHEWRLTYQSHVWRPTYQSHVEIVGVALWVRRVDAQCDTVGEDCHENEVLKRSDTTSLRQHTEIDSN